MPQTSGLLEVMGRRSTGRAPPDEALSARRDVPRVCGDVPCPLSARGNQMARPEKVAVVDEIRTKLGGGRRRGAHRVPRPDGPRAGRPARRRCARPAPSTRCSRTRWPAGPSRAAASTSIAVAVRGPGRRSRSCAATPRPRRRRCATSARTNEALVVKGGLLGERVITPVEIEALADLPSREVLLAQIAGVFQAAADQGRRPVPGLHPQLRLRRARR